MNKNGKKLNSYCHISSGGTPSRKKKEFYGGDILWATIADIEKSNGIIIDTKEKITKEGLSSIGNRIFKEGTLLLAMYGSVGKVAIAGKRMATNQAILGIAPKSEKEIFVPYLKYWLLANKPKIIKKARGGILKNLSAKIVKNLKIDLPIYDDQIKIANLLSQVEALIAKREESIKLLDELLKSTFLDMFGDPVLNTRGWEINFMKDITKKITDGTHKSPPMSDTGYKYITAKHIKKNNIIDFDSNPTYIEKKYHDEIFSRCNPELGDILYIKDGATTGIACINKINEEFSLLSSVALLKPNEKINNYYLTYFLNIAKKKLIENMAGGAIKRLTLKKIKLIKVPLPPKSLQNKFAIIVQQVEESKKRYQESLNELHQLFGSLSQRAFKGELDLPKDIKKDIIVKINSKEINLKKDKEQLSNISSSFINSYKKEMERMKNAYNNIGIYNRSLYGINIDRSSLNSFSRYEKEIEKIRKILSPLSNLNRDIFDLKKQYEPFLNSSLTSIYNSHTKDLMQRINGLKFTSLSQLVSNSISKALNTKHSYNTALKQLEMLKPLSSLGDNYESLINRYNSRISNLTCILESIPKLTDIIDDELFDDVYLSATYDDIKELIFRLINDGKLKQVFDEKSKTLIVKKANNETN